MKMNRPITDSEGVLLNHLLAKLLVRLNHGKVNVKSVANMKRFQTRTDNVRFKKAGQWA